MWVNALGSTKNSVSNTLITQELLLEEIGDTYPSNISVMCQAERKPGGNIDEPTVVIGIVLMPYIENPGVNVPTILQLKMNCAVYSTRYFNTVNRSLDSHTMNWTYIKTFRELNQAVLNWEDPSDLPEIGQNMPITKLLEHVQ